jgi:hypothetical protein
LRVFNSPTPVVCAPQNGTVTAQGQVHRSIADAMGSRLKTELLAQLEALDEFQGILEQQTFPIWPV